MSIYYLTPLLFFGIAFVFSMLGMGGSQLYIPILFWLGMDFKTEAIPLGMLLNVVNSGTAAITYARKRLIDWKLALPFGISMVLLAPVGAWMNIQIPAKPLLLFFALFTATAAVLMLSGWKPKGAGLSVLSRVTLGLGAGSVLGLIAGLIGRGGGSFVVPLLYLAGLNPQAAAATSSLVVTGSGISSFLSHLGTTAQPDWILWFACVASVFLGGRLGSRTMTSHLTPRSIRKVFGVVLLGVAALILVRNVILA
jgi:uncharacterized membrane protein YfcA